MNDVPHQPQPGDARSRITTVPNTTPINVDHANTISEAQAAGAQDVAGDGEPGAENTRDKRTSGKPAA